MLEILSFYSLTISCVRMVCLFIWVRQCNKTMESFKKVVQKLYNGIKIVGSMNLENYDRSSKIFEKKPYLIKCECELETFLHGILIFCTKKGNRYKQAE